MPGEDNPLAKLVIITKPTTYKCVIGTISDIPKGIIGVEVGQSIRAAYNEDMVAKVVLVSPRTPELAD